MGIAAPLPSMIAVLHWLPPAHSLLGCVAGNRLGHVGIVDIRIVGHWHCPCAFIGAYCVTVRRARGGIVSPWIASAFRFYHSFAFSNAFAFARRSLAKCPGSPKLVTGAMIWLSPCPLLFLDLLLLHSPFPHPFVFLFVASNWIVCSVSMLHSSS